MIPNEFSCLSCGEFFFEEPEGRTCPVCFEDSVVDAAFAERMSADYDDEND